MKRRDFIQKTALTSSAVTLGGSLAYGAKPILNQKHTFN
ncbi:MAG: twin-arginine translocation signal domain-containing protein [Arenibacter algicola]|nr:twin-arginine translocation signal domain-containing protein [Arenibacter algicola]